MSVPNSDLIYCVPIQTYFVDKTTGAPLSAGVVTFYKDTDRTASGLKNIYQQSNTPPYTFTALSNPITLSGVGTFQDGSGNDINVYLYPYAGSPSDATRGAEELYYVTVYSSGGVLQETRSAWPPNVQANFGSASTINSVNQITNSQFVEVLFQTPTTFTVTGPNVRTQIAPGWFVLTSGTGTFTVSQIAIASGVSTNGTGAPYDLTISSATLDSLAVYQRITGSPLLLAGGPVYGYAQIASVGGSKTVSLTYEDSSGNVVSLAGPLPTNSDNSFTTIEGSQTVPIAATGTAPTAYVDFVITLVPNFTFRITSVEMLSVADVSSKPGYFQESVPLQVSNLYWYDKPNLFYKPIPSYLTAWDFPLNPGQELGVSGGPYTLGAANRAKYIADQTILFQSVDSTISFLLNGDLGLNIASNTTPSSFSLIQYIAAPVAVELLQQTMSVAIQGGISAGTITGQVNLYYTLNAAVPILPLSLVTSITGTVPALTAGWIAVPRSLGAATFTLSAAQTPNNVFSGFNDGTIPLGFSVIPTYMAIVITFPALPLSTNLNIDYVSLNGGNIATRPAPQTPDEVLRECQYYYEKSYNSNVVPGTAAIQGSIVVPQVVFNATNVYPSQFSLSYNSVKVSYGPLITFYSLAGTINAVSAKLINTGGLTGPIDASIAPGASPSWNQQALGNKGALYNPANTTAIVGVGAVQNVPQGWIQFQYVVDSRLGVI